MLGRFETRGDIGIIVIENPPVNAISVGVREALIDGAKKLAADPALKAGVLLCAGRTFMAGADITEFGKPPLAPSLQDAIDAVEGSKKPIVAAIHGTAFGGGLEIALACHYRVAVASAQVGLPEVKLGILPGAGGTQRLPRLIGVQAALDVIVSGDPVPAAAAKKAGVLDEIVEGDLLEGALAFARGLVEKKAPHAQGARSADRHCLARAPASSTRRASVSPRRKSNLFAPQRIVDAVEAATQLGFDEGVKRERELFMECAQNSQARALQHVFFAERRAANIPNLPKGTATRPIRSVAVIGAGTMGGGIAMNFANVGIPVTVLEVSQEGLDRGLGVVRKNYENSAKKGRFTVAQMEERLGLIKPTLSYEASGKPT